MDAYKEEIRDNCAEIVNDLELLINEISNDRRELAQKLTTDEDVNAYAVVERCNQLNAMIRNAKEISGIFERANIDAIKHLNKKIIELTAFVEIEYPAYNKVMSVIKNIYVNLVEFIKTTQKRRYNIDIEELFANDIKKFDTLSSIAMDIVVNKKLLKRDMEDKEVPIAEIKARKEKIEELEFIFKYISYIPNNN